MLGLGGMSGSPGGPRGYRYRSPGGHVHEIFWEAERWTPPPDLAPTYPNRPQRYQPRGVAVNHIDHVTISTADIMGDVAFFRDTWTTGSRNGLCWMTSPICQCSP